MSSRIDRGERLLLTHRGTVHLLERSRLYAEGGRVLYTIADGGVSKTFAIPHANMAVLLLGQGTSLTSEAARLLAEEGVGLAFTGTGGTPLHYGSLTNYQPTRHMQAMHRIWSSDALSLAAARIILSDRIARMRQVGMAETTILFGEGSTRGIGAACDDLERDLPESRPDTIMSAEAHFAKACYRALAEAAGFTFRHMPGAGKRDAGDPETLCNSYIDQGNYLAYGIAGTVLWTLGIPASLSVLHGKTRAGGLVFDLADSFKDAFILPSAFSAPPREQDFRARVITLLHDRDALKGAFETMNRILALADGNT